MAPVAAGLANSDTRFHREKWPSSLTRGGHFVYPYAIGSIAQNWHAILLIQQSK